MLRLGMDLKTSPEEILGMIFNIKLLQIIKLILNVQLLTTVISCWVPSCVTGSARGLRLDLWISVLDLDTDMDPPRSVK
jgi:hypothetical protein